MSAKLTGSALTKAGLAHVGLDGHNLLVGGHASFAGQQLFDLVLSTGALGLTITPGEMDFTEELEALLAQPGSDDQLMVILVQDYPARVDERPYGDDPAHVEAQELLKGKIQNLLEHGMKLGIWLILTDAGTESLGHVLTDDDFDRIDNITDFGLDG